METHALLSQLRSSPNNARRTYRLVDIPILAALIKSQGLLQNLVVRDNGDSSYDVVEGERRRAAIRLLLKSGDWPKDRLIPIKVLSDEHNDTEVSLAANTGRVDMHPADTFEAFRQLVEDQGQTPEAIGMRFGYAVSTVRGFLKLANVSPRLMKAFRKNEVTLDQMQALAITDDHKRQETAFYDSPEHMRNPRSLRRMVMEGRIEADDKFARFVGLKAYETAGGQITRDLFGNENEAYIEDSGLLHQLVTAKLEAKAVKLREEGWKWVEVHPDLASANLWNHPKVSQGAHGFDPDSDTAHLYAGVILGVERDGKLAVHKGLLKPEDAKALKRAKANPEEPEVPAPKAKPGGAQLTASMIEELTAIRTMAVRCELSKRPHLTLAIVVHDLALAAFYEAWDQDQKLTEIAPKLTDVVSFIAKAEGSKAVAARKEGLDGWATRLPSEVKGLWPWMVAQKQSTLLELLAIIVAGNINMVRYRHEKTQPARIASSDRLAIALDLDMAKWWQPDARFLSRISKAAILAAVAEGVSPKVAASLDHGTKGDLVPAAERKLAKSNWLPVVLRTPQLSDDQPTVTETATGQDDGAATE
jgi:ParB family chromosome partitioning protein